jgi:hypothetical protein
MCNIKVSVELITLSDSKQQETTHLGSVGLNSRRPRI